MTQPDQQWPLHPQPTAQTDQFTNPAESGGFTVLIEELRGSGEGREWRAEQKGTYEQRTQAQDEAASLARNHQPRNPMMPQGRKIWRLNPDEYLVMVSGLTAEFHFRVSVGELLRD